MSFAPADLQHTNRHPYPCLAEVPEAKLWSDLQCRPRLKTLEAWLGCMASLQDLNERKKEVGIVNDRLSNGSDRAQQ
jgi:hypothetical protein